MADFSLSGKFRLPFALRILFLGVCLVIIPLLVHIYVVYDEEKKGKRERLYALLTFAAETQGVWIQEKVVDAKEELRILGMIAQPPLEEVAKKLKISPLFWGKPPSVSADLLYVHQEIPGRGILTRGLSAQELIWHTKMFLIPYQVSLFNSAGGVIATDQSDLALNETALFTKETLFQNVKGKKWIGVQLRSGSDLTILITTPVDTLHHLPGAVPWLRDLGIFLWWIILLGGGLAFWLTRRMAKPLMRLSREMESLGKGNIKAQYLPDRFGFEINTLGARFNDMIRSLLHHMEQVKEYATELRIAREMQESLLPKEALEFPGLRIATGFLPAKEVGGDFYDLFVRKNQLLLAIADTSGKGVHACLYSLLVRSMLRMSATSASSLEEMLKKTNALFCQDTGDSGVFVTLWAGLYEEETRTLTYSSAGHLPALLRRENGSIEDLQTEGTALGVISFEKVLVSSVVLQPGDLLLLYTDGIIEARSPKGELFGSQRLHKVLQEKGEMADLLLKEVDRFCGGVPPEDDLTLVVIQVL